MHSHKVSSNCANTTVSKRQRERTLQAYWFKLSAFPIIFILSYLKKLPKTSINPIVSRQKPNSVLRILIVNVVSILAVLKMLRNDSVCTHSKFRRFCKELSMFFVITDLLSMKILTNSRKLGRTYPLKIPTPIAITLIVYLVV